MSALRHLPNALTVLRVVLVAPIAYLLWVRAYPTALILLLIAGVSDALDGALARRFDWGSAFGAALDPVADKLLIGVLFVVFTLQHHLPLWVTLIAVGRDALIMGGAAVYRWLFEQPEIRPTFLSKVNTATQLAVLGMLLVALCEFAFAPVLHRVIDPWSFYVLAVLGVASGIDYVITWSRRAWARARV